MKHNLRDIQVLMELATCSEMYPAPGEKAAYARLVKKGWAEKQSGEYRADWAKKPPTGYRVTYHRITEDGRSVLSSLVGVLNGEVPDHLVEPCQEWGCSSYYVW